MFSLTLIPTNRTLWLSPSLLCDCVVGCVCLLLHFSSPVSNRSYSKINPSRFHFGFRNPSSFRARAVILRAAVHRGSRDGAAPGKHSFQSITSCNFTSITTQLSFWFCSFLIQHPYSNFKLISHQCLWSDWLSLSQSMVMRDGTRYQCLVCSNSARDMYNSREHMYTHLESCLSVHQLHSFVMIFTQKMSVTFSVSRKLRTSYLKS